MVARYPDPPSGNITVQMASNRKYASLLAKLRQEESVQADADLKVFQAGSSDDTALHTRSLALL